MTNDLTLEDEAMKARRRAWMVALAGTSAALATSFLLTDSYAARVTKSSVRDLARSRDVSFDMDARGAARRQGLAGEGRADLLERISDVCLAGSVAATGAVLLIWLTGRKRRPDQLNDNKTLLGPMVLRGANGGGLVLREKF